MSRSQARTGLIALHLFVAATAIGGGIALATGLEGGRFPLSWLAGTPFVDYVAPGLILACVVGGSAAAAVIALVRRSPIGRRASLLAGVVLVGWIAGEIALVRADNDLVSPIEAVYGIVGLATIGLAVRMERSRGAAADVSSAPAGRPALAGRYVRPTFVMARLVNPIVARLGGTLVLVVQGRRSGQLIRVPLGRPLDLDGVRYLVAGGGETHWVRNLRAAGAGELRLHGAATRFRAVEVDGEERDRIVAAYKAAQGRTVETFFRSLPQLRDHPVFRVEPIADVPGAPAHRSVGS